MASGTINASFAATPERVWAILTAVEDAPRWVPDLLSAHRLDDGPLGVGSKIAQVMRVQGRSTDITVTITRFDPPATLAHSGEGKSVRIGGRVTISEAPGGCDVKNDWSLELSGLLKLGTPLAVRWTENNIRQTMDALRTELESRD